VQFIGCGKSSLMPYNFIFKDNNQKAYRVFVWFLFFLHIVAAGLFVLNVADKNARLTVYILLGFYALISIGYYFFRKRKKSLETFGLIMALLYADFWFQHVGVIALIIFVLLYLFVTLVQGKKTSVLFSLEGVYITRVFKTFIYSWQEMDNVILKDNLLTIDLRSNKIIQAEIVEGAETVDEKKFNEFCTGQLQKKSPVLTADGADSRHWGF
jgi:LPXTG-motif cell wall-anchored protein